MNNTPDIKLLGQSPDEPGALYKKADAKAMFLAGYKPRQIAEKLGLSSGDTVTGWALRENWHEEREKILTKQTSARLQELLKTQGKDLGELQTIREKAIDAVNHGTVTPTKFSEAVNAYISALDMERKLKVEALQLTFVNDIAVILREEIEDREILIRIAKRLTSLFEQYQAKSMGREVNAEPE